MTEDAVNEVRLTGTLVTETAVQSERGTLEASFILQVADEEGLLVRIRCSGAAAERVSQERDTRLLRGATVALRGLLFREPTDKEVHVRALDIVFLT